MEMMEILQEWKGLNPDGLRRPQWMAKRNDSGADDG